MERKQSNIALKVAVGVFLGLCAFGLVTCTGLVVVGGMVEKKRQENFSQALKTLDQIGKDPNPLGINRAARQRQLEERARIESSRRLAPGERCIQGQRFRRVNNGWEQVGGVC